MAAATLFAAMVLGGASAVAGIRHALRRLGKRKRDALTKEDEAPTKTPQPAEETQLLTTLPVPAEPPRPILQTEVTPPRVNRRVTPPSSARRVSRQEFARGPAGALIPEATVTTDTGTSVANSSSGISGVGSERWSQRRSAAGSAGLHLSGAFDAVATTPSTQQVHNGSELSPDHAQPPADADGLDSSSQLDGSLDYSDDSDRSGMDPRHPGEPKSAKAVVVDLLIESALLISKPPLDRRHFDRETRQNLKKMRPAATQGSLAEIAERGWEGVEDITKEVHRMVSHAKAQDKYAMATSAGVSGLHRPVLGFSLT